MTGRLAGRAWLVGPEHLGCSDGPMAYRPAPMAS